MFKTLKRYSLDTLLEYIANYSLNLFSKTKPIELNPMTAKYGNISVPFNFLIAAWELTDISYYAVINTSDKRDNKIDQNEFRKIVNEYKKFSENKDDILDNIDTDLIPLYIIYGHSQKQFWYQEQFRSLEMFNRNLEMMLHNSKQIESRIDIGSIVKKQIGLSVEKYINISLLLFGIGLRNVDITTVMFNPVLLQQFNISEDDVKAFREYYSATYEEIRNSKLQENIFFTKPIVKTNSNKYIIVNSFLLLKVLSDGLYWLVRNYYADLNSQAFVNEFGFYFEKYVESLFNNCLDKDAYFNIDTSGKSKKADWIITFDKHIIIIEQKSMLASIKLKQQHPNLDQLLKYVQKYSEAFDQLNSTENSIKETANNKIITKFVLHYDELYDTEFIKSHISKKRNNQQDSNIYFLSISELERLVYLSRIDNNVFEKVFSERIQREQEGMAKSLNIDNIISELYPDFQNNYITEYKDHFTKYTNKLRRN